MQEQELRRIFPRMLFAITREETEPHLREVFKRLEIPVEFQIRAHGTAHSELLDALGLSGSTRIITIGILPKVLVPSAFDALNRECNFYQRGAGIAFTLPVLSTQNHLLLVHFFHFQFALSFLQLHFHLIYHTTIQSSLKVKT